MSSLFGGSSAASNASSTLGDLSKDVALTSPPDDSISDLAFSSQSNHLSVSSWDNKVRIYEISATGGSEGKALFELEKPALSTHWSKVGSLCLQSEPQLTRLDVGRYESGRWRCGQQSADA